MRLKLIVIIGVIVLVISFLVSLTRDYRTYTIHEDDIGNKVTELLYDEGVETTDTIIIEDIIARPGVVFYFVEVVSQEESKIFIIAYKKHWFYGKYRNQNWISVDAREELPTRLLYINYLYKRYEPLYVGVDYQPAVEEKINGSFIIWIISFIFMVVSSILLFRRPSDS